MSESTNKPAGDYSVERHQELAELQAALLELDIRCLHCHGREQGVITLWFSAVADAKRFLDLVGENVFEYLGLRSGKGETLEEAEKREYLRNRILCEGEPSDWSYELHPRRAGSSARVRNDGDGGFALHVAVRFPNDQLRRVVDRLGAVAPCWKEFTSRREPEA